jgi:hypothetical protein
MVLLARNRPWGREDMLRAASALKVLHCLVRSSIDCIANHLIINQPDCDIFQLLAINQAINGNNHPHYTGINHASDRYCRALLRKVHYACAVSTIYLFVCAAAP